MMKQEAHRHISRERYGLAEKILAEALKLDPDSADLHELIATVQIENGSYAAANASASRATEICPAWTQGHMTLAWVHYQQSTTNAHTNKGSRYHQQVAARTLVHAMNLDTKAAQPLEPLTPSSRKDFETNKSLLLASRNVFNALPYDATDSPHAPSE